MSLTKIEKLSAECIWGIWEINESLSELENELAWENAIIPAELIRLEDKKKEKLASRILLKRILENWNQPYEGTSCHTTRKPFLRNCSFPISVSHSHQKAVAIIHQSREIGIDIELIDPKISIIAPRVFSKDELAFTEDNTIMLTILWSMKETLYKINGERGIDFRDQLFILPFTYQPEGGTTKGIIKTKEGEFTYTLQYYKHDNHVIVFNRN